MALIDVGASRRDIGPPRWVAMSLEVKEGRDPLGLQTTTHDRLMPRLLPGILELSRRARYFSFHAFLLDLYRELRLPADRSSLSRFIKTREWEFGLAVLNCPHNCGSSPVGAQRLRTVVNDQAPPYPRGESVESPFGGYGLYYRSPLAELGIVARPGTLLGEQPITVDLLYDTDRAHRLADTFRAAVQGTEYGTSWILTTDPLPLDVLVEYARVGCLCQLERAGLGTAALRAAICCAKCEHCPGLGRNRVPERATPPGLCTKNSRHAVPHPHARPSERHDHIVPAIAGRKRRKNVGTNVAVQARVPLHLREKAQRAAAALGVAMGAYLEQLMLRDQLDDSDKPAWAEDFYAEHPEFADIYNQQTDTEAALQGVLLSA